MGGCGNDQRESIPTQGVVMEKWKDMRMNRENSSSCKREIGGDGIEHREYVNMRRIGKREMGVYGKEMREQGI